MSPSERRQQLLETLCRRRHDTYGNLAREFNVSERTICRDVAVLMCSYPVETVCVDSAEASEFWTAITATKNLPPTKPSP